ncbi:protein ACCELERATED CELL DEATH 6-like [Hordeum vulgare]|nr:protein ACCELERATED CELL DEATH 6-like [Hordeum vulgare]
MDSRRWRSSFGVMVASMTEAPAKAGTSICFEDEPVEDGGGDTCECVRPNSENKIYHALRSVGANYGAIRWDKAEEPFSRPPKPEEEDKESRRLKDATQTSVVASVLIATVAFSAAFAIPGGYRSDDHINGGTPTYAGSYVFDAFMMATTLY